MGSRPTKAGPGGGVGRAERLAGVVALLKSGAPAVEAWKAWGPQGIAGERELEAAAALAATAGTPLVDTLTCIVELEMARERLALARSTALAGPRASAAVLRWLPLAGLGIGALVEPRTLSILTGTALGWACLGLGLALSVAARAWMRALVSGAERAGVIA